MPERHRDHDLLRELEPVAEQLLNRHLAMAKDWMSHEYAPWSLGRDFDVEPWTPDQPRLTGVAQAVGRPASGLNQLRYGSARAIFHGCRPNAPMTQPRAPRLGWQPGETAGDIRAWAGPPG